MLSTISHEDEGRGGLVVLLGCEGEVVSAVVEGGESTDSHIAHTRNQHHNRYTHYTL